MFCSFSEEEEEAIEQVKLLGFAGELKLSHIGDETENECFYNMFGQGVNLAMKAMLVHSIAAIIIKELMLENTMVLMGGLLCYYLITCLLILNYHLHTAVGF